MEINWYYISVWIANSVNYFFFFVRKQLELFMYSYFQAYQAEWLYKNYFLFSSREQSKAIMGLTSEKEYVSWCFCCQWFMNTVHLICHACVDSVQLGYVLLARTLCLGEITFAGLSFPQETELCGMLTGRRDESFVDWQKRCELCWLSGKMRALLTGRKIRALLTGRRDQSFVDWQEFGKIRALLTGRKDQSFVDWQGRWGLCWLAGKMRALLTGRKLGALLTGRRDQSFVDWQGRWGLCWLAGKMRALLTGRKLGALLTGRRDQSFVDWQERSELCWLTGKIRALLTGRKDGCFNCWLAGEMRAFLTDRRDGRNLCWRSAFVWWSRVPGLAEAVNLGVFSQTLWTRSCKFDIILLLTSIMKLLFWDASVLVTFCVWCCCIQT